jgi:hypothetical protein
MHGESEEQCHDEISSKFKLFQIADQTNERDVHHNSDSFFFLCQNQI